MSVPKNGVGLGIKVVNDVDETTEVVGTFRTDGIAWVSAWITDEVANFIASSYDGGKSSSIDFSLQTYINTMPSGR